MHYLIEKILHSEGVKNGLLGKALYKRWPEHMAESAFSNYASLIAKIKGDLQSVSAIIESNNNSDSQLLNNFIQQESSERNATPVDNSLSVKNKDLRIKKVTINGFRSIPFYDSTKFDYGLELAVDRSPVSATFLGGNGSGKTSIYSALELVCTKEVAIEKKHKIDPVNKNKFRRHITKMSNKNHVTDVEDVLISLEVVDSTVKFEYKQPLQGSVLFNGADIADLRNFFCSESDLSMFECGGDSVTEFIEKQMGFEEVIQFQKFLKFFIDAFPNNHASDSSKEEISDVLINVAKIVNDAKSIESELNRQYRLEWDNVLANIQITLKSLLDEYIKNDDSIELAEEKSIEKNTVLFSGKLRKKGDDTGDTVEPRWYFNNFRFKLYIVSIKVALAFHIMKTTGNLFPLIFDDIFDCSDFPNRLSSKRFFQDIFKVYHELKIANKDLQIILFTQDEVIANCVYQAMTERIINEESEESKKNSNKVIFGRIYPSEQYVRLIESELKNSSVEERAVNKTQSSQKFINLAEII